MDASWKFIRSWADWRQGAGGWSCPSSWSRAIYSCHSALEVPTTYHSGEGPSEDLWQRSVRRKMPQRPSSPRGERGAARLHSWGRQGIFMEPYCWETVVNRTDETPSRGPYVSGGETGVKPRQDSETSYKENKARWLRDYVTGTCVRVHTHTHKHAGIHDTQASTYARIKRYTRMNIQKKNEWNSPQK